MEDLPQVILLEISLSLLGLGIRPAPTSLGQMLGAGRAYLTTAWWIAVPPGTVIFLTNLSISIVGDWARPPRSDPALTLEGRSEPSAGRPFAGKRFSPNGRAPTVRMPGRRCAGCDPCSGRLPWRAITSPPPAIRT